MLGLLGFGAQVLLILLKLTETIEWTWLAVLSPAIVMLSLPVFMISCYLAVLLVALILWIIVVTSEYLRDKIRGGNNDETYGDTLGGLDNSRRGE